MTIFPVVDLKQLNLVWRFTSRGGHVNMATLISVMSEMVAGVVAEERNESGKKPRRAEQKKEHVRKRGEKLQRGRWRERHKILAKWNE